MRPAGVPLNGTSPDCFTYFLQSSAKIPCFPIHKAGSELFYCNSAESFHKVLYIALKNESMLKKMTRLKEIPKLNSSQFDDYLFGN